jgi:hypothetical protein
MELSRDEEQRKKEHGYMGKEHSRGAISLKNG